MIEQRFVTQEDAEAEAEALNAETDGSITYGAAFVNHPQDESKNYWIVECFRNER